MTLFMRHCWIASALRATCSPSNRFGCARIAPLPGYEDYALEPDKSATWYRNHVPNGYALVLIFNRPTSDAQSLKDVYPITESLLATKGLEYLIGAAFATYQLSPEQMDTVRRFLDRLRPFPQLRDLAEFLCELDVYLHKHPGAQIEMAIAESLPALGFFRCRELAHVLNTTKGDTLLHNVQRAARLGSELLDDRQRDEYLSRLAETEFDDDSAYGGLTAEEKRALLHRFLSEVVADRRLLLDILRLDWREVASVLHKSRRKSRSEQLQSLAVVLQEALLRNAFHLRRFPKKRRICSPICLLAKSQRTTILKSFLPMTAIVCLARFGVNCDGYAG